MNRDATDDGPYRRRRDDGDGVAGDRLLRLAGCVVLLLSLAGLARSPAPGTADPASASTSVATAEAVAVATGRSPACPTAVTPPTRRRGIPVADGRPEVVARTCHYRRGGGGGQRAPARPAGRAG